MARTDALASAIMAAGTLVSRVLGLVRTVLITVAIGSLSTVGDVFEVANTLPNLIYVLVAGGAFNAVLVPQIIKAAKAQDGGALYISKLVTLTVTAIGLITVIMVACAWPIIDVMGSTWTPEQKQLGVIFSLWCLPQIFFYGLYTVIGQVLNAKDAFGAYMWSPALNNVISSSACWCSLLCSGRRTPPLTRRCTQLRTGPAPKRLCLQVLLPSASPCRPSCCLSPYAAWGCIYAPISGGAALDYVNPLNSPLGRLQQAL